MPDIPNIHFSQYRDASEQRTTFGSVSDEELIREIDQLFNSYEQWSADYPKNFRAFTVVKRIIDVSISGGFFLSHDEKRKLFFSLHELKEGLLDGSLRHADIQKTVEIILLSITENNSKARLVSQTTKVESYILSRSLMDDSRHKTQDLMNRIIAKITPSLPEMSAMAIAKEMHLLIERVAKKPEEIQKAIPSLEGTLKQWL